MRHDNDDPNVARRARSVVLRRDEDGNLRFDFESGTDFIVDEHTNITQIDVRNTDFFFSCGHPATIPVGGRCYGCQRVSCYACFVACADCRRPLCLHCVEYLVYQELTYTFCPYCIGRARRWKFYDSILEMLG